MHLDLDVRCVDEHCLEIFDVPLDAKRIVAVGPRHDDVFRVALTEPVPLLITEDVEVERVEDFEILLHCRRLLLGGRWGCRGVPLGNGNSREYQTRDSEYADVANR